VPRKITFIDVPLDAAPVARIAVGALAAMFLWGCAWSLVGEVYDAISDFSNPQNYAYHRLFER
jgi:hypothetical protein